MADKNPQNPNQTEEQKKQPVGETAKFLGRTARSFGQEFMGGVETLGAIGEASLEGWINIPRAFAWMGGDILINLRNWWRQFYAGAKGEEYYVPVERKPFQYKTLQDILSSFRTQPQTETIPSAYAATQSQTQQVQQLTQQQVFSTSPFVIKDPLSFLDLYDEFVEDMKKTNPSIYQKLLDPKYSNQFKAMIFRSLLESGILKINTADWNSFFSKPDNFAYKLEYLDFLPLVKPNDEYWKNEVKILIGQKQLPVTDPYQQILKNLPQAYIQQPQE